MCGAARGTVSGDQWQKVHPLDALKSSEFSGWMMVFQYIFFLPLIGIVCRKVLRINSLIPSGDGKCICCNGLYVVINGWKKTFCGKDVAGPSLLFPFIRQLWESSNGVGGPDLS